MGSYSGPSAHSGGGETSSSGGYSGSGNINGSNYSTHSATSAMVAGNTDTYIFTGTSSYQGMASSSTTAGHSFYNMSNARMAGTNGNGVNRSTYHIANAH